MPVADRSAQAGRVVRHRIAEAIDVDIIIAGPVHFREAHGSTRWRKRKRDSGTIIGERAMSCQHRLAFLHLGGRISSRLDQHPNQEGDKWRRKRSLVEKASGVTLICVWCRPSPWPRLDPTN